MQGMRFSLVKLAHYMFGFSTIALNQNKYNNK